MLPENAIIDSVIEKLEILYKREGQRSALDEGGIFTAIGKIIDKLEDIEYVYKKIKNYHFFPE